MNQIPNQIPLETFSIWSLHNSDGCISIVIVNICFNSLLQSKETSTVPSTDLMLLCSEVKMLKMEKRRPTQLQGESVACFFSSNAGLLQSRSDVIK